MRIYRNEEFIPNRVLSASEKDFFGEMEAHGHNFFELEYIISGEAEYTVDGVLHTAAPNTLFLMSPAAVHEIERSNMHLINLMFATPYDEDVMPLLLAGSRVFSLTEEDALFLVPLLRELAAVQERAPDYAILLLRCVLHRLSAALPSPASRPTYPLIGRAMLYVREHFSEDLSLADVAEHLGLSYAYFSDLFVKEAGMGFKEYLDGVRLSYAKNLVCLTDLPIGEVCERAGFADYANFSRRFRHTFGVSAREMRQKERRN